MALRHGLVRRAVERARGVDARPRSARARGKHARVVVTDAANGTGDAGGGRDAPGMTSGRRRGARAPFAPSGDQPSAIEKCAALLRDGDRKYVCLRGATGTGKTFVVANVLAGMDKPALVVVPNKTLAAQVARELRAYLGETHRVELFVSHFSVYVPESYSNGRYTEKRSAIDADLDALRHRATRALVEPGKTPVIVASVSCLYGLGLPTDYVDAALTIEIGAAASVHGIRGLESKLRDDLLYERVMPYMEVERGQFKTSPAPDDENCFTVEIWPPYLESALELRIRENDGTVVSCQSRGCSTHSLTIWPRVHYITPAERLQRALVSIQNELEEQSKMLRGEGFALEADRLEQRTNADLQLLRELGWCPGAEHYSRHLRGARPEEPPVTLLDYFSYSADGSKKKRDWILVADESHVMLPQLRAMHGGDRSRKLSLVAAGYRLPSALDNRPLMSEEFWERVPQALLVSATPGDIETSWVGGKSSDAMVDMVVRPSGVLDPPVHIIGKENQLEQLAQRVSEKAKLGERSLVCVLTKADTEDLSMYLNAQGVRADWVHSELTAPQRAEKLSKLQRGELDCIVGAQLLREGLDLPSVSLVAILDADVPGFMRSARSLMQMAGRAARNKHGECVLFADSVTGAMRDMMSEVDRRREKQHRHNVENNLTPTTATLGSSTSTLSLFEVMADEITKEKEKWVVEQSVGLTSQNRSDVDEEAVEKALRSWRKRREGGVVRPGPKPSDSLKMENANTAEGEKLVAETVLDRYGIDATHVERLRRLHRDMPAKTGVYRWLDVDGKVLYIGKAKNLRSRTGHYLSPALIQASPRHRKLLASARTLDAVLTPGGEADALALEARLIQRERPALNILLKDAPKPESARIVLTSKNSDGRLFIARFQNEFDPSKVERVWTLPTREAAIRTMAFLERALDLRGVSFRSRFGETAAIAQWKFAVDIASMVLDAKYDDAIAKLELHGELAAALEIRVSAQEEAERGQGSRGSLAALLQADSSAKHWNMDIIAAASSGGGTCAVKIVKVRDGVIVDVLGSSVDVPNATADDDIAEATLAEAAQLVAEQMYASETSDRPDVVYIPHVVAEPVQLRAALKSLGIGGSSRSKVLHHGSAKEGSLLQALADVALENADESARATASKSIAALRLKDAIALSASPKSIEGVDVSHLAGQNAVTSFVRFEGGSPAPLKHKRYELSEAVTPSDDYGGIAESITARLSSKGALPDVLMIDGGAGQLTAAANAILEAGVVISNMVGEDDRPLDLANSKPRRTVALCALAKGRSSGEEALWIPALSPAGRCVGVRVDDAHVDALRLLRAVRDSAHAVALGAHRNLRREERLRSVASA